MSFADYIIISCLFNIPYYWFNWEEVILKYIIIMREEMIKDIEERDPTSHLLTSLRDSLDLSKIQQDLDDFPVLHLIKNLLFFPVNLCFLCYIMIDKFIKK